MKDFAVYTGLRLVLFAACFGILWLSLSSKLGLFPLLLLALLISSILSIFVLRAARERLAGTIESRAGRISDRIERSRRTED
jgi:membrane protein implicated in regulation of membrane protease activity